MALSFSVEKIKKKKKKCFDIETIRGRCRESWVLPEAAKRLWCLRAPKLSSFVLLKSQHFVAFATKNKEEKL